MSHTCTRSSRDSGAALVIIIMSAPAYASGMDAEEDSCSGRE